MTPNNHIVLNKDFAIISIGSEILGALNLSASDAAGKDVNNFLRITKPGRGRWDWGWLLSQEDLSFRVEPTAKEDEKVRFTATTVHIADFPIQATIALALVGDNQSPSVPCQNEEISKLREALKAEQEKTEALGRLRKTLLRERALLENLVPKHIADGMRRGETVPPREHKNVTFYFSDIVGFTDICKQVYPWQVTGMLNRLYCVMDYLAAKFNLFKVETIGDAYVCASGLPEDDAQHAQNIANFAIAVSECSSYVLSPVDGTPIQMRIGVHTGSAASGVVGVTNPRYCVFGDTVNVTARHESTGEPGKIHCSCTTRKALLDSDSIKDFTLTERGLIALKGKGELRTYWLEASPTNPFFNEASIEELYEEVEELLQQTKFDSQQEQKTAEESFVLMAKLGSGACNVGKNQQMIQQVLGIIKEDLNGKVIGCSQHTSQHGSVTSDRSGSGRGKKPFSRRRSSVTASVSSLGSFMSYGTETSFSSLESGSPVGTVVRPS